MMERRLTPWRLDAPHATAGQIVAEVVGHGDAAPVIIYSDKEAEATDVARRARLIAAAPAMLAALQGILTIPVVQSIIEKPIDRSHPGDARWLAVASAVAAATKEGC
jgi:hypothetical protein